MILIIDNYDSFVHNVARYFERAGSYPLVVRNDAITIPEIRKMNPQAIVISPGPCTPKEAGISVEAIRRFGRTVPILGICLGHQCIGEAFGGQTVKAFEPVHGRASNIRHNGEDLFKGLPETIQVGRYHSLITELQPDSPLKVTALGPDGEIMAMKHEERPIYGVQFHPESILTPQGFEMIRNFVELAGGNLQIKFARKAAA